MEGPAVGLPAAAGNLPNPEAAERDPGGFHFKRTRRRLPFRSTFQSRKGFFPANNERRFRR